MEMNLFGFNWFISLSTIVPRTSHHQRWHVISSLSKIRLSLVLLCYSVTSSYEFIDSFVFWSISPSLFFFNKLYIGCIMKWQFFSNNKDTIWMRNTMTKSHQVFLWNLTRTISRVFKSRKRSKHFTVKCKITQWKWTDIDNFVKRLVHRGKVMRNISIG